MLIYSYLSENYGLFSLIPLLTQCKFNFSLQNFKIFYSETIIFSIFALENEQQ